MGGVLKIFFMLYPWGGFFSFFIFTLLPAPGVMGQVLAWGVFPAVPNVALIYTTRLGVPMEIASALHPLTTAFMIPVMSAVMLLIR